MGRQFRDGLFDFICDTCDPLSGDCLSVASAISRICSEGDLYALIDQHDHPTHFFYGINGKYIDGNGVQNLDSIKQGFVCDRVKKYNLKEEDPRYEYSHMIDEELINDICQYNRDK